MPSHPDRVRRNYHTIETVLTEEPYRCAWEFRVFITKQEIASWAYPNALIHSLMQQVRDELYRTFNRGK